MYVHSLSVTVTNHLVWLFPPLLIGPKVFAHPNCVTCNNIRKEVLYKDKAAVPS